MRAINNIFCFLLLVTMFMLPILTIFTIFDHDGIQYLLSDFVLFAFNVCMVNITLENDEEGGSDCE